MEDTLNYFQPEVSDIRVGYECEMRQAGIWEFYKVPYNDCLSDYADMDGIRVSYLTKEAVEAEGWEIVKQAGIICPGQTFFTLPYKKQNYWVYIGEKHNLYVEYKYDSFSVCKFDGQCRCINDFRTIIKLLGL